MTFSIVRMMNASNIIYFIIVSDILSNLSFIYLFIYFFILSNLSFKLKNLEKELLFLVLLPKLADSKFSQMAIRIHYKT